MRLVASWIRLAAKHAPRAKARPRIKARIGQYSGCVHTNLQLNGTAKGRALNRKLLFWALQCAGWLVFGSAMFAWGLQFWRPRDAAVEKAILVSSGFVLTMIFRFLYRRLRFRRSGHIATTIAVAVLCTAGAALWIEAQVMLFGIYCNTMQPGSFEVSPAQGPRRCSVSSSPKTCSSTWSGFRSRS